MKFRKDINGLRAFAVIAVVLFHFNSSWMPGGFAGVDVFFVISGFLMTGIIFKGIEQENFSILKFYIARANRIIPALALLCFTLLVFGWFYLTPLEYKTLGKHAASSITFLSNIVYWREAGYFDAASHQKWLLHTWSLSVEWQFYMLYPLILIGMRKLVSLRIMKIMILAGTVIGFVFCGFATYKWPNPSYFLLSTRAWEMMIGGVAYLYPFTLQEKRKKFVEWLGLALIIASYFLISAENPWPGYLAIFPVFGSFLILQAQRNDSIITGNIIFQKIGSWSYSIYLWHWPIVVIIYYFSLDEAYIYIGMMFSIFLGFLSYKYIERNKFISSYAYLNYKKILTLSLICLSGIFVLGNKHPYKLGLVPDTVLESIKRGDYECFDKPGQHIASNDFCTLTEGSKKILAFGDSHSYSVLPAIEKIAKDNDLEFTYTGYSGCPPLVGVYPNRQDQDDKNCNELNNKVMSYVSDNNIDYLILSARWTYYTEGDYSGSDIQYLYSDAKSDISQEASIEAFRSGIKDTFEQYSKSGAKVLVLLQVPLQEVSPDKIFYSALVNNELNKEKIIEKSVSTKKHNEFQKRTNDIIIQEANKFANIRVVDPTTEMCGDIHCPVGNETVSYYFDDDHLSISGSLNLKDLIEKSALD